MKKHTVGKILQRFLAFIKGVLVPPSKTGRAAVMGVMAGIILMTGYIINTAYLSGAQGLVLSALIVLTAAIPGAIIAMLVYGILKLLFTRVTSGIVGLIAGLIIILSIFGYPAIFVTIITLAIIPFFAALAALIVHVTSKGFRTASLPRRIVVGVLLAAVLAAGVSGSIWFNLEGSTAHLVSWENPGQSYLTDIDLPNPSEKGQYQVSMLYYGEGTDIRRPEYGKGVSIVTNPVDVTPFLPQRSSFRLGLRERFWGFDLTQSPLNGRVWYPEGDGPFPLVLIVHGNHEMTDYSDPGYAYLGELLASRGYITVSVDQNFLNGSSYGGDFGGQGNAGRAWILLEHLKVWREWQHDETNPFFGKVDMENIALIGHSRGGEAVAIAAAFNQLPHYPDDANITFDYNFHIKSLVAFAPTDEFYTPAGRPIPLTDVNYLLLHGAHDGDVSVFMGNRQYQRTEFSGEDYNFKSVVYIYQANHGQFNTGWGSRDLPPPFAKLLNVKPLMPEEEQRQVAEVYISAFLDSTLKHEQGYLPLFQDHRTGSSWLPETIILSRFQDSTFQVLSNFEEDINLATTTASGGTQQGINFTEWKEGPLSLRMESMKQANNVVFLGWNQEDREGTPIYSVSLPKNLATKWELEGQDYLAFSMADLGQGENPLLDVTITLEAEGGASATLKLSDVAPIILPLPIQFTRLGAIEKLIVNPVEPVLQSYELHLSSFVQANPKLALSTLKTIRFTFDSPKGNIALDDIGFRRPIQ